MDRELYTLICEDVRARDTWARKQEYWYRMRGPGIRRSRLPWQGAANLHYPLADGIIDKMKPFYLQQLYAHERFADFTGKPGIDEELVQSAAYWFDYKLRYKSNLEEELAFVNDDLLVYGRGILKCTWNVDEKKICHESIEPIYLIVPENCRSLELSERIVHVKHLTPWEYKYGPDSEKYNQDADFLKRITGSKDETQIDSQKAAQKLARGITHTDDKIIIVWEVYEKGEKSKWTVHTISPCCPDEEVRDSFELPYKLYGKSPFIDFPFEDRKGYYESRGVCEILADMEGSMNKMWNEKHDCMTLYNRPVFSADRDVPNTGNIKLAPGQILPFKVAMLNPGAPPISFDQEMANTRFVAEQRVAVPDFGVPSQSDKNKQNKTATEVQAIMTNQNLAVDMRARSYRRSLGHVFCVDWYLLKQHDKDLGYTQNRQSYELNKEALEAIESIEPSGTADAWDTTKRQQKAVARFTMFRADPFIKQGPLRKNILALDQPGLVNELYQDPMEEQRQQASIQAMEIPALEAGLPVMPSPTDDPMVHLRVLLQRAVMNMQTGMVPTPNAQKASQAHIMAHMQQLQERDPKAANRMGQQFAQLAKVLQGGPWHNRRHYLNEMR